MSKVRIKATGRLYEGKFNAIKVPIEVMEGDYRGNRGYAFLSLNEDKIDTTRQQLHMLGYKFEDLSLDEEGRYSGFDFEVKPALAFVNPKDGYIRIAGISPDNTAPIGEDFAR